MEQPMLGITKKDRKIIEWRQQKTQATDVIHRFKTLEWQWAGHLAGRTDNRRTTRMAQWHKGTKSWVNLGPNS